MPMVMTILVLLALCVLVLFTMTGTGLALGYAFLKAKSAGAPSASAIVSRTGEWMQAYGNIPAKLPKDADGNFYFDYGEPHYIYTAPGTVGGRPRLGQTITMRFSQVGEGTLKPADPADTAAACVRLFLQDQRDDMAGIKGKSEFYRLWGGLAFNPGAGDFTIRIPLDPSKWTGVWGVSPSQAQMTDTLNNLLNIGWTHGASGAGHGQVLVDSSKKLRFVLKEYSVA